MTTNRIESISMKNFVLLIALLIAVSSFGQKKWTLEECVMHAIENNITVKQGQNTVRSNKLDVIAGKANFYPS